MAGLVPDRGRGDWPRRGFAIPCRLACHLPVKPGNSAAERAGNRKRHHQDRLLAIRTARRSRRRSIRSRDLELRSPRTGELDRLAGCYGPGRRWPESDGL